MELFEYIPRSKSILTGIEPLEPLYTLRHFPVFMGCVEEVDESKDIVADMEWGIDVQSGVIQLTKLVPLDILYLNQHNDGTGKIWDELYKDFADFILRYCVGKSIIEIGGAHDRVAKNFMENGGKARWTIVEPNPENIENKKITVIKDWFDKDFSVDFSVDTIVHSHVLEHTFNPQEFIQHISKFLKSGDRHIFAFPNMLPMLKNKFTNCINFEHTIFLTEYFVEYLLVKLGFKIIAKEYFGNPHSIFYATEKVDTADVPVLQNKYTEYKKIFSEFIIYHEQMVAELNRKIEKTTKPVYLFGAHIFSQYLINFGLKTGSIVSILDNSLLKQKKRLYGTNMKVASPQVLAGKGGAAVILKAGIYNEEIKKDILENINPEVEFW